MGKRKLGESEGDEPACKERCYPNIHDSLDA
jgi:hypothetical protein